MELVVLCLEPKEMLVVLWAHGSLAGASLSWGLPLLGTTQGVGWQGLMG